MVAGLVVGSCSVQFGNGSDSPEQSSSQTPRDRNRLYLQEQERSERQYQFDKVGPGSLTADARRAPVPLAERIALTVGAQYHDQRSVGSELIGSFDTWNVGAHARLSFWDASVDVMFNQTGDGADIRSPYGTWPGYLSMINRDLDRAGETAWGVKLTYDFKGLGVPGLTAFSWFGQGNGAIDLAGRRGRARV